MRRNEHGMYIATPKPKKEAKPKVMPCIEKCGYLNKGSRSRRCPSCSDRVGREEKNKRRNI